MDIGAMIRQVSSAIGFETWIVQIFVVVLATAIVDYASSRVLRRLERATSLTRSHWDDALIAATPRPARALIWIVGIAFSIDIIQHHAGGVKHRRDHGQQHRYDHRL